MIRSVLNFVGCICIAALCISSGKVQPASNYLIPEQTMDLYSVLGVTNKALNKTIPAFEISHLVTLGEYKVFLADMAKDSSAAYCKTLLPDTSAMPPDIYQAYFESDTYNDMPAIAVSWENAMNFCRWKTINQNKQVPIDTIYRLPTIAEWLSAYAYVRDQHEPHDLNGNYSDWTINSMFNNMLGPNAIYPFPNYFHSKEDAEALKRKVVLGNSFAFRQSKLADQFSYSYLAGSGYKYVGFRYVVTTAGSNADVLTYWNLELK